MIPKIFIPGRREELRNYTAAIYSAGGLPVCSADPADAALCGGLLLPGGGDIGERLDEEEQKLIQSFVRSRRPVLGICRGMQALNVFFGGDLRDDTPGHQQAEGDLVHEVTAVGSMAALLGRRIAVTSNHHQSLRCVGEGLTVTQVAPDGVAEAVEHRTLPIWGVQWHPERQSFAWRREDAADATALFAFFVERAR